MGHRRQAGKLTRVFGALALAATFALHGASCSYPGPYGYRDPTILPGPYSSRDLVRMPPRLQPEEQRRIDAIVDVLEREGFYPVSPFDSADTPLELTFQLRSNLPLDVWCEIVLLRHGRELARGDGKVMGPWALIHGTRAAYDDAFRQALDAFRYSL